MRKVGPDYWHSETKQRFDRAFVALVRPGLFAARSMLSLTSHTDWPTVFAEERIGLAGKPIWVEKLRVEDPETGEPLGRLAARASKLGVDELAQIANIQRGEMSAVGRRPLEVNDHYNVAASMSASLRGPWNNVVHTTLPGIVSSYALYHHTHPEPDPNEADIRAEMDIRDAREDSWAQNVALVKAVAQAGLERRLR